MAASVDDLKKTVFHDLLDLAGRVFMLVRYSSDVVIGKRGFLPEEKEKGLVLVFNRRMRFEWNEAGISARLVFGSTTEQCFIPSSAVMSVFSPDLGVQFVTANNEPPRTQDEEGEASDRGGEGGKVVKVDFGKRR